MFETGLRGFIQKPFYIDDLMQRVRDELITGVIRGGTRITKLLESAAKAGVDCAMSKRERSENLVQVHHAHDEWEGNIIVGYLRDNGVEATLQDPPSDAAIGCRGEPERHGEGQWHLRARTRSRAGARSC